MAGIPVYNLALDEKYVALGYIMAGFGIASAVDPASANVSACKKKDNKAPGPERPDDKKSEQKNDVILPLSRRIDALESLFLGASAAPGAVSPQCVDAHVLRACRAVASLRIHSAQWKWVTENYYAGDLSSRAQTLGAHGKNLLCKSLLLENRAHDEAAGKGPTNPRHCLVVVQYEATFDAKKLARAVRALRTPVDRIDPSKFDFRVASEEDNALLTGYPHNAVCPFGLVSTVSIPIVVASAIPRPSFVWMGGGHSRLKLGLSTEELVGTAGVIMLDITVPRP